LWVCGRQGACRLPAGRWDYQHKQKRKSTYSQEKKGLFAEEKALTK